MRITNEDIGDSGAAASPLAAAWTLRRERHSGAAVGQYRALLGGDPPAALRDCARVALAEILLAGGDLQAAANEAAAVPDDNGRGAVACRIETCAWLAAGDVARGRQALVRAAAVGLPEPEAEMFEAWIALADGEGARPLPVASIPLLGTLLELMLGADALDAAEALRILLGASRLPRREQHQLLAEARLRHGDLAGAAAEWMEVCHEQPDASAMLGLARIAANHDLSADALTFAAAALELDRGCTSARELIDALTPSTTSGVAVIVDGRSI